jgi:DNA-binding transcriptional regulator YhcF (GntR family)
MTDGKNDEIVDALSNPVAAGVVLPFPTKKGDDQRKWDKMWGKAVIDYGYVALPRLLFEGQTRLGLNATQMLILLQLANKWWDPGNNPWPSKDSLAKSLGLSSRQVQRILGDLEAAGFIARKARFRANGKGQTSNEFDLSGLVQKLKALEPEFTKARKVSSDIRNKVKRRGGLAG